MSDWIFDNFGWVVFGSIILLCVLLFMASKQCHEEQTALIAECVQSGRQPFECKAMFQGYCKSGDTGTYVSPVIINSGRR